MAYSTIPQVTKILAKALTSFTPQSVITPGDLLNIGTSLNTNQVNTSDINYYINLADGHINAALSQQYLVPLMETCDFETSLTYDVSEYNGIITLDDVAQLNSGNILVFQDGSVSEKSEIESIDGFDITLTDSLTSTYMANTTRVMWIKFPDPISFMSARLAASTLYEKYFSAQSSPNNSDHFKTMKSQVVDEINNIREGRTILHGATKIANRFYNSNLGDRYGLAPLNAQDGTRSDTAARS